MSETLMLPPAGQTAAKRVPTVYFIDDSATMREVIKIAFRRENINVITCADAATAMAQFERNPPDAVITDVIMPDQDGYSVCNRIKEHPKFGTTPVILMSGVVNKSVADKAIAVHADELIRKPFQPQELIGRVKNLLQPKTTGEPSASRQLAEGQQANALGDLFIPQPAPQPGFATRGPSTSAPPASEQAWPRALAEAFSPRPGAPSSPAVQAPPPGHSQQPATPAPSAHAVQKLRAEILRLELLVKKLQTELQIEREYTQTLELHIKTLRESE